MVISATWDLLISFEGSITNVKEASAVIQGGKLGWGTWWEHTMVACFCRVGTVIHHLASTHTHIYKHTHIQYVHIGMHTPTLTQLHTITHTHTHTAIQSLTVSHFLSVVHMSNLHTLVTLQGAYTLSTPPVSPHVQSTPCRRPPPRPPPSPPTEIYCNSRSRAVWQNCAGEGEGSY